jgi:hypothetical protein
MDSTFNRVSSFARARCHPERYAAKDLDAVGAYLSCRDASEYLSMTPLGAGSAIGMWGVYDL